MHLHYPYVVPKESSNKKRGNHGAIMLSLICNYIRTLWTVDHIATEPYKPQGLSNSESQDIGFLVIKTAIKTLKALIYFTIKYQRPFHSTTLRTWKT